MRTRAARRVLPLLVLPVLLSACVNDRAAYEIDGSREHTLTLIREQPLFWDKKVNLSFVVARMPVCMRRHEIGPGSPATRVEVWQVPSGAYIVKAGKRLFATETQTCESFARIEGEPAGGMGRQIGTFLERRGELVFEPAEAGAEAPAR